MAGTKTIYNSTGLECGLEVLERRMGVRIDRNSADCAVVAMDGNLARLNIVSKPVQVDGSISTYIGDADFTYHKLDLNSILPDDLAFDLPYPTTFEKLQAFLKFSFDFLIEENEFTIEGGSTVPLKAGDAISVPANAQGQLVLRVHANSCRWKVGGALRMKQLAP